MKAECCVRMKADQKDPPWSRIIRSEDGNWNVYGTDNRQALGEIRYCPFCGKKLPTIGEVRRREA